MKKTLPTDITNELAGSSVFFQRRRAAGAEQPKADGDHVPAPTPKASQKDTTTKTQPRHHATTIARNHATKPAGNHETTQPDNQAAVPLTHPATTPSTKQPDEIVDRLEAVRRAVKQPGREAATYRLTSQEKRTLADLVYTYQRQGWRTSENEITRIAVNWLLLEFEEAGARSILARILERLHG